MTMGIGDKRVVAAFVSAACLALAFTAVPKDGLVATFRTMGVTGPVLALLLVLTTLQLSVLRYLAILDTFGERIPWAVVSRAVNLGAIGSLAPISVLGQTVTRWAVLRKANVSASTTVVSSLYERLLALTVLLALGLVTTLALAVRGDFPASSSAGAHADRIGPISAVLAESLVALMISTVVVSWTVLRRPLRTIRKAYIGEGGFAAVSKHALLCVIMHGTTLSAYFILIQSVAPQSPSLPMLGAIILIMVTSSVPVSVGGWGFRELGALVALPLVGIGEAEALAISITVGALFTIGMGLFGVVALFYSPVEDGPAVMPNPGRSPRISWRAGRRFTVRAIALATAMLALLPIGVPVGGSTLNVTLADPLALTATLLLLANALSDRTSWTRRRIRLQSIFALGSLAIVGVALANGVSRSDYDSWPFLIQGLGWIAVLAFFGAGSLSVQLMGELGLTLVLRLLVAVSCSILAVRFGLGVLVNLGYVQVLSGTPMPFVGHTGKLAGFAFTVVLLLGAVALLLRRATGTQALALYAAATALVLALIDAHSRGGFSIVLLSISLGCFLGSLRAHFLGRHVVAMLAASGGGLLTLIMYVGGAAGDGTLIPAASYPLLLSSLAEAFQLAAQNPIFGAGMGAIASASYGRDTSALPIVHPVPLWLLAELGMVGLAFFAWFFVQCALVFVRCSRTSSKMSLSFGLWSLGAFAIYGLVDDVLYQRLFWFLLGASLAAADRLWKVEPPTCAWDPPVLSEAATEVSAPRSRSAYGPMERVNS